MKIVTWNVNGIRACEKKGFYDFFKEIDADIFCVQESKAQPEQIDIYTPGYFQFWHSAVKKGYSGTGIFTKTEPLSVAYSDEGEGRVITLEFGDFYLVNAYVPNAQRELTRLAYRCDWEDKQRFYLQNLTKPVIYCGDLNVAHNEIDLKNPKSNVGNAGFTFEERGKMSQLLAAGFVDVFRSLYPEKAEYTWWSYMQQARQKDIGWRLDYFIVSQDFLKNVKDCVIHKDIMGSDHCPVSLIL